MEELFLFHIKDTDADKIKRMAGNMKIRVTQVLPSSFGLSLAQIVARQNPVQEEVHNDATITASIILFANVTEKHFDKLLFEFRKYGITADYKAVLTPTNKQWTLKQLVAHLEFEKITMRR